jgi:oligopeptidase B
MKETRFNQLMFCFIAILIFTQCNTEKMKVESQMFSKTDINPPIAEKEAKELTIHSDTRIDNYYWMKLSDEQKNAKSYDDQTQKVIDYLNSENDYTESMLNHTKEFQDKLYEEIVGRIKQTDLSVPYKDNGYFYLTRFEEGKEYPIYSRKKGNLESEEEILLDENVLAQKYSFYRSVGRTISPDNKIMAYGEDTLSRRIYTIKFKNLETGEMMEDEIPNTTGGSVWANDNNTIFYTVKDAALRSYKIFRHKLGTPFTQDVEIFHEADETFSTFVYKTKSKKYIIVGSWATVSNEFRVLDANDPEGTFKLFQARERDHEYMIDHSGDHFYIRTNMDAKNFQLMKTSEGGTSKENWETVIANRDDVLLEGFDLFKDHLVVSERIMGITQLRVIPNEGEEHYIDFGEDAFLAYTTTNPEYETSTLRLGYTSMTTPNTTYDYDMVTKEFKLLKQQEVVGEFNPDNYQSERLFVKVRDGVEVPISLVYKKGFKKDGSQPILLYAYGSYGSSSDPYFSSVRLSLLDRGFGFAIAHIRGGEEMGRHWYEDGKLLNKKNTFTDFIDCGKYLVDNKYVSEEKLFAMGGSAGGLLMGAIVNMAPQMWKGVVAAVPFVDVVTTMLDETIPLTTGEYDEWGNPNIEEYYNYIKSYSPYDNVEAKDYPAIMVTTGLHDSQVQYWEPAKWVAKLRELKTDNNPLVLHTNMKAGHGGASGRFERYKVTALEYAFFLDLAGRVDAELLN